MPKYIVNLSADDNGCHGVHEITEVIICKNFPVLENRIHLGWFENCVHAMIEANARGYKPIDGCKRCSPECYNS